jgi:hypothetical protein
MQAALQILTRRRQERVDGVPPSLLRPERGSRVVQDLDALDSGVRARIRAIRDRLSPWMKDLMIYGVQMHRHYPSRSEGSGRPQARHRTRCDG